MYRLIFNTKQSTAYRFTHVRMFHAHIQATINWFSYCFIDKLTVVTAAIASHSIYSFFAFVPLPLCIVCVCECIACNCSEAFYVFEQSKLKPKVHSSSKKQEETQTQRFIHSFIHSRLMPLPSDVCKCIETNQ